MSSLTVGMSSIQSTIETQSVTRIETREARSVAGLMFNANEHSRMDIFANKSAFAAIPVQQSNVDQVVYLMRAPETAGREGGLRIVNANPVEQGNRTQQTLANDLEEALKLIIPALSDSAPRPMFIHVDNEGDEPSGKIVDRAELNRAAARRGVVLPKGPGEIPEGHAVIAQGKDGNIHIELVTKTGEVFVFTKKDTAILAGVTFLDKPKGSEQKSQSEYNSAQSNAGTTAMNNKEKSDANLRRREMNENSKKQSAEFIETMQEGSSRHINQAKQSLDKQREKTQLLADITNQ